jgi:hypothetical protein
MPRYRINNRAGLATVELVLITPILIILFACIWNMSVAGIGRMHAAARARAKVVEIAGGKEFDPVPSPDPFENIANRGSSAGLVQYDASIPLSLRPSRMFGSNNTAGSHSVLLTDTWDHNRVTFPTEQLRPGIVRALNLIGIAGISSRSKQITAMKDLLKSFINLGQVGESISQITSAFDKMLEAGKRLQKAVVKLAEAAKAVGNTLRDLADKLDPSEWDSPDKVLDSLADVGKTLGGLLGGGGGGSGESPLGGVFSALREVKEAVKAVSEMEGSIANLPNQADGFLSHIGLSMNSSNKDKFNKEFAKKITETIDLSRLLELIKPENLQSLGKAGQELKNLSTLFDRLRGTDP